MAGIPVNYGERLDKVAIFITKGTSAMVGKLGVTAAKELKIKTAIGSMVAQVTSSHRTAFVGLIKRMDGISSRPTSRREVITGSKGYAGTGLILTTLGFGVMEVIELALTEATRYIGSMIFKVLMSAFAAIELLSPNFYPASISALKTYAKASGMSCEDIAQNTTDNPVPKTPQVQVAASADDL
jgi:hypothetical protein